MQTYILTIEELIKALKGQEKNGGFTHAVLSVNAVEGQVYAPSERKPFYKIPMIISGSAWKTKNVRNIGVLSENIPCAMILVKGDLAENLTPSEIRAVISTDASTEGKRGG